jgi:hypothetical protein
MRPVTLAALVVCLSCAGGTLGGGQPESEASRRDRLEAYLAGATDLTPEQRQSMRRHQPFRGMTVEQARLAMESVDSFVVDGRVRQATFVGGEGIHYRIVFEGDPARAVDWTSAPEVELREPEEFRPNPPLHLPR